MEEINGLIQMTIRGETGPGVIRLVEDPEQVL